MTPSSSGILLAFLSTAIGIGSGVGGLRSLAGAAPPRGIVPFSGGLLMGIALFGVVPELAQGHGWTAGLAMLAAGIVLLWAVGRYVYPVCPSCSHTHEHQFCSTALHGFGTPLIIAASLHALLDGVGIAASQQESSESVALTLVFGVVLHKIPEGIALGIMLRAALKDAKAAMIWLIVAESATAAGGVLESAISSFSTGWTDYALALAGGSFLYLGFHAVHGEWRRRGVPAFMPALTGAAGAAALQQGLRVLFR